MIVLAFSGGLDTSFCVPYLRETYGADVVTVTVDTGGLTPADADAIEARARALGAAAHRLVDGRQRLWDDHLSYLVKGNVLRGDVYPLCVGPERVVQARAVVDVAAELGATAIAHGSTGAGNDQVRFDVALAVLADAAGLDGLDVHAPIRTLGLTRQASTDYLTARGFDVPAATTTYSVNRGLWGTTVGGQETLTTAQPLPEGAYPDTTAPAHAPDDPLRLTLTFEAGLPVALDGEALGGVALVERLGALAGAHGVGRDLHVGDTILGIKGRVGFEAPAAVTLVTAHRELEKLVLSKQQLLHKRPLADLYGHFVHEGRYFDPLLRDIEAFLDSGQRVVTGTVDVEAFKGHVRVLGAESPHSLFDADAATYGETHALWDGRDAEGFTTLAAVPARLAQHARRADDARDAPTDGVPDNDATQRAASLRSS